MHNKISSLDSTVAILNDTRHHHYLSRKKESLFDYQCLLIQHMGALALTGSLLKLSGLRRESKAHRVGPGSASCPSSSSGPLYCSERSYYDQCYTLWIWKSLESLCWSRRYVEILCQDHGISGLQHQICSSLWRVNKRKIQRLGHWSADLVGILIVRHSYACCAQWGVCVRPRVRKLISFVFNGEVSFEVLFCSFQLEGSMLLIYRNEKGVHCTTSRGLDLQWRWPSARAFCEAALSMRELR